MIKMMISKILFITQTIFDKLLDKCNGYAYDRDDSLS